MYVDLTIAITADNKKLTAEAAAADGFDVAAWVGPIRITAARARVATPRPNLAYHGQKEAVTRRETKA
jgi:hypothetical protein